MASLGAQVCCPIVSRQETDPTVQKVDDSDASETGPQLVHKDGAGLDLQLNKATDPGYPGDGNQK